jgi:HD-like signal output (HDOD) protein
VALTSTIFAERTRPPSLGLTFTAGLLHDIGKVVLNEYVAREFAEIARLVNEEQFSFDQAEQKVLGSTSSEIGARLGEKWQLPDSIVRCIRYHRTPSELDPPDALVDTVYLADCVCMLCGVGLGEDGLCYRAAPEVMERYHLKESDLEAIGAQMLMDLRRVQELFTKKGSSPMAAVL